MNARRVAMVALALVACGNPIQETASSSSSTSSGASSGSTGAGTTSGSSTGSSGTSGSAVQVQGAVEKGPFVLGSSIIISAVDPAGTPTGRVFNTQTTSDLGAFSVNVPYAGDVQLVATGYFFDELDGSVSTSTLTLEGYGTLSGASAQLDVNVLTHVLSARVTALEQTGLSMAQAASQAEAELQQSLAFGPAGFSLSGAANEITIGGGAANDRAYLLAVSVAFLQLAHDTASAPDQVDARLQELLNDARSAFATSGALPAATVTALHHAATEVEPQQVVDALQARYAQSDPGFTAPDVNAVLDSDDDGFPNDDDACPRVASDDGGPMNGICSFRRAYSDGMSIGGSASLLIGDFTGDGIPDVVQGQIWAGSESGLWIGTGGGAVAAHVALSGVQDFLATSTADVNGDGHLDLVGMGNFDLSGPMLPSFAGWAPGYGDGGFGPVQTIVAANLLLPTADVDGGYASYACGGSHFADLNGDGRPDAIVSCQENELYPVGPDALLIAMQLADGGFAAPNRLALSSYMQVYGMGVGDFDGDGKVDVVVGSCGGNLCGGSSSSMWSPIGGLWIARGLGDGGFSIEALSTSIGPNYSQLLAGDVNGDGFPDLLVTQEGALGPNTADVLLNDGTGHFSVAAAYHLDGVPNLWPFFLDLTGDGRADVAFLGSSSSAVQWYPDGGGDAPSTQVETYGLQILPGTASGWGARQSLPLASSEMNLGWLGFGDLDGDGHTDVTMLTLGGTTQALENVVINPAGYHSW